MIHTFAFAKGKVNFFFSEDSQNVEQRKKLRTLRANAKKNQANSGHMQVKT